MTLLPGFDDWLAGVLAEQAADAGESVDHYVARAVAARLMADVSVRGGEQLEELQSYLTDAGLLTADRLGGRAAVIADPDRLRALYSTKLLDSPPEQAYDRIVEMAAEALATPFAAMTLVDRDRQFFKSLAGVTGPMVEERQTPLDRSLCRYAVASGEPLVVVDARADPVLKHNPAVLDGDRRRLSGHPVDRPGWQRHRHAVRVGYAAAALE